MVGGLRGPRQGAAPHRAVFPCKGRLYFPSRQGQRLLLWSSHRFPSQGSQLLPNWEFGEGRGRCGGGGSSRTPVPPVTRLSERSIFFPGAWLLPTPLDPEPILCIACLHLAWGCTSLPPGITMETGASASIPELICEAMRRIWIGVGGGRCRGRPKR